MQKDNFKAPLDYLQIVQLIFKITCSMLQLASQDDMIIAKSNYVPHAYTQLDLISILPASDREPTVFVVFISLTSALVPVTGRRVLILHDGLILYLRNLL